MDVITGGGPDSTNVPYFVFQRSIGGGWQFGQASAYSIVVVIASIVIATFGLRVLSNLLEGEKPMRSGGPSVEIGKSRVTSFVLGLTSWVVALVFFFPIFWMVLNGFKEEIDANTDPKLVFDPTLDRFDEVTSQTQGLLGFREAFMNSVWAVSISTILVLVLAIPAAYALAIRPVAKWRMCCSSSSPRSSCRWWRRSSRCGSSLGSWIY